MSEGNNYTASAHRLLMGLYGTPILADEELKIVVTYKGGLWFDVWQYKGGHEWFCYRVLTCPTAPDMTLASVQEWLRQQLWP